MNEKIIRPSDRVVEFITKRTEGRNSSTGRASVVQVGETLPGEVLVPREVIDLGLDKSGGSVRRVVYSSIPIVDTSEGQPH